MRKCYGGGALSYLTAKVLLLALLLELMLAGCRPESIDSEQTPTPFSQQIPAQRVTTAAPIPISLEHLAANPDFYIGATLQLTGQFKRLPILACEAEAFPSPATWGLEADGYFANATGLDSQLRNLLNEGQVITVQGRWLKHDGLVGCEGNLQEEAVWYLSTDRVIDPYPLLRSEPAAAAIAQQPTPENDLPAPTIEQPLEQPDQATAVVVETSDTDLTSVPTLTSFPAEATPVLTATNTITPFAPATAESGLPTPTQFASQTPLTTPNGTPTATPNGSPTASTQATPTLALSATPSGSSPVEKGELGVEDLTLDILGAGATDSWNLDLLAGDAITITVAPATTADIVLSILDSNGSILVDNQNTASAGEVETVRNLQIADAGIHRVLIKTAQGLATDYAIMFMDANSYSFIFRGRLVEGTTRNESLAADNDHFWFYDAEGGESISFTITPDSTGDPYIELYDPDGARMLTIDDTGEGEPETLDSYTLLDPGIYAIRVAEFDFRPMSYQIRLTKL